MRHSFLTIAFTAVAACSAAKSAPKCGMVNSVENYHTPPSNIAKRDSFQVQHQIKIQVYAHVLAANETVEGGFVEDETVNSQIAVLNTDFAQAGISFTLAGIDHTVNADWSSDKDPYAMRAKLRRGGWQDLNLYIMPESYYYGYCALPDTGESPATTFIMDGCTVRSDTLPGGPLVNYNMGRTATHEVGHWFGLLHTFQGGCEGGGDLVNDTPAEMVQSGGCPTGRDSCPSQEGEDPIHNFMDYSFDSCYEGFTEGQIERMFFFWTLIRSQKMVMVDK